MTSETLTQESASYLAWLVDWEANLPSRSLREVVAEPARAAVVSVDVINGFCHVGPLASDRVKGIIAPITRLMMDAYGMGVRHFVLTQDTHEPDAVEFGSYPPHCVRGTAESEAVPEFKALPFYGLMQRFAKNSISSTIGTGFGGWLEAHPKLDTFIVVGDCTDLCTYQLAMGLKLRANAGQRRDRVIVPVDCVDTYDTPVAVATELGIQPHPAALLHRVFLHNMASNGVEVLHIR
ncbi:MAG TPA: isochorismatase family protein [Anaerolineales bacterium]|nr:isochorismatase family protein [Anaerolineales bacterium]HRF46243.1 isochorismatase family protein [Anaerolineales bacterium]